MKIKLEKYYQNVNGVRLTPGIHDVPATLAEYLINNGHAVAVEDVDAKVAIDSLLAADVTTDEQIATPYHEMTLKDLRALLPADVSEADVVADVAADWRVRRDEIADYLISLES